MFECAQLDINGMFAELLNNESSNASILNSKVQLEKDCKEAIEKRVEAEEELEAVKSENLTLTNTLLEYMRKENALKKAQTDLFMKAQENHYETINAIN